MYNFLKKIVKKYKILKEFYYFKNNWFSEYGILNRILNSWFAKYRDDFDLKNRTEKFLNYEPTKIDNITISKISSDLKETGSSVLDLSEITGSEELLKYIRDKANPYYQYTEKEWEDALAHELMKYDLNAKNDTYDGKIFWLDLHTPGSLDCPITKFCLNPTILKSVSKYIGAVPMLEYARLIVNPGNFKESHIAGSRLYHIDTSFENMVKIFVNPFHMTEDNGPTSFLPKSYTSRTSYRNFPIPISDADLALYSPEYKKDLKSTIGEPGKAYIVDVAKCLHQGGRCILPRTLLSISYVSPSHYMTYKYSRNSNHASRIAQHSLENSKIDELFRI